MVEGKERAPKRENVQFSWSFWAAESMSCPVTGIEPPGLAWTGKKNGGEAQAAALPNLSYSLCLVTLALNVPRARIGPRERRDGKPEDATNTWGETACGYVENSNIFNSFLPVCLRLHNMLLEN